MPEPSEQDRFSREAVPRDGDDANRARVPSCRDGHGYPRVIVSPPRRALVDSSCRGLHPCSIRLLPGTNLQTFQASADTFFDRASMRVVALVNASAAGALDKKLRL